MQHVFVHISVLTFKYTLYPPPSYLLIKEAKNDVKDSKIFFVHIIILFSLGEVFVRTSNITGSHPSHRPQILRSTLRRLNGRYEGNSCIREDTSRFQSTLYRKDCLYFPWGTLTTSTR